MFSCEKCGKDFDTKFLLNRHLSKKLPCNTIDKINKNFNEKIKIIDDEIKLKMEESMKIENKCLICNKNISNKGNLIRHINNTCKIKKELIRKKENLLENKNKLINNRGEIETAIVDKDNEIKALKKTISKLLEKQVPQNITINNPTINNNTQNNIIVINSFGKEDLSHITEADYKKYLNNYFPGFIKFIEKIHFDENMPSNHNLCITNIKSKYMYIYENNNWNLTERNDIIDRLITNKYDNLIEKFDDLEEAGKISDKVIDNFTQFQHNYNNEEAKKNTKKDVELMIYNNKNKIKSKVNKN